MNLGNLFANAGKSRRAKIRYERTLRAIRPDRRVEVSYREGLLGIVGLLKKNTEAIVRNLNALGVYDSSYAADASRVDGILGQLKTMLSAYRGVQVLARQMSNRVAAKSLEAVDSKLIAAVGASLGVDVSRLFRRGAALSEAINKAVADNVALITSIPAQHFEKLEDRIRKGVLNGDRASTIAKRLLEVDEMTEGRAKLIARDQVSKMNSSFNSIRQQDLGIESYIWQTSGDERVREEHAANDGKKFSWANPPDTGHPGEEIGCRCVALPVFDLGESDE